MQGRIREESKVEKYAYKVAKARGVICLKIYNPASAGWPDRLFVLKYNRYRWVEFKAEGEDLRPLQVYRCEKLAAQGCRVWVIDNKQDVERFFDGSLDPTFVPRTSA